MHNYIVCATGRVSRTNFTMHVPMPYCRTTEYNYYTNLQLVLKLGCMLAHIVQMTDRKFLLVWGFAPTIIVMN